MEKYFIHRFKLSDEEILNFYREQVLASNKFTHEINEEQISLSKGFLVYPFIEGNIKNLEYFILFNGKEITGVLDTQFHLPSREFLLKELKTKDFTEEELELDQLMLMNSKEIELQEKKFIEKLIDKTKEAICKRHNFILTNKKNWIDIAPIKEFENLQKRYYLEEVVQIDYFERGTRKVYQSLFSSIKEEFYTLDFIKNNTYIEFYKRYKNPIVRIPKEYLEEYYSIAFPVYLNTLEELKYITPTKLLEKLRKNIDFKSYTKHKEYLEQLIFFFKKRSYLRYYSFEKKNLKKDIFYFYLTLKYHPESGYQLAELTKNDLVEEDYVRLLSISEKLGNTLSRKCLFEYYSHPKNYNEVQLKRYTKQKEK